MQKQDKDDIINKIIDIRREKCLKTKNNSKGETGVQTIHNVVKTEHRPKKKPKKLIRIAFSKRTTIILMLVVQFALIWLTFTTLNYLSAYVRIIFSWLAIFLGFVIINTDENPAYKLAWIVPLIAVPVFTSVLYLILNNQYSSRRLKTKYYKKCAETRKYLRTDKSLMNEIRSKDRDFEKLVKYIERSGGYPAYRNSTVQYLPFGETKFEAMLRELRSARKFIFMEYFIIDDGKMWQEVVEILLEKVEQGVEVRLIYDGMGSQFTLPFRYKQKMAEKGIKTLVFNPFRPMISSVQNNRDHRKILVVDGNSAITGGVNIADEYINQKDRFGHWKDNAVLVKGEAVWNFTMMFIQMWDVISGERTRCELYRPDEAHYPATDGVVIPYSDSPLDTENVGELVYMDIINNANDYIYITTPYLIPDNEMITALGFAAKSGVDVRIITPGIPDKWYVHCITRSFYKDLMDLGVRIYEYQPGFIHAKTFVSDDDTAVVGTINLDYRSLYLHFECAAYMRNSRCIADIKADMLDMFKNSCNEITYEDIEARSTFSKLTSAVLKPFAPLL